MSRYQQAEILAMVMLAPHIYPAASILLGMGFIIASWRFERKGQ